MIGTVCVTNLHDQMKIASASKEKPWKTFVWIDDDWAFYGRFFASYLPFNYSSENVSLTLRGLEGDDILLCIFL